MTGQDVEIVCGEWDTSHSHRQKRDVNKNIQKQRLLERWKKRKYKSPNDSGQERKNMSPRNRGQDKINIRRRKRAQEIKNKRGRYRVIEINNKRRRNRELKRKNKIHRKRVQGEDYNIIIQIIGIKRHPTFKIVTKSRSSQYVQNDLGME